MLIFEKETNFGVEKNYLDKDYEFDGYISDMISFEILENKTFFLMEYLNSWYRSFEMFSLRIFD